MLNGYLYSPLPYVTYEINETENLLRQTLSKPLKFNFIAMSLKIILSIL